jgi:hypothetical protein
MEGKMKTKSKSFRVVVLSILTLGVLSINSVELSAQSIEDCASSDAKCVGKALLKEIRANRGGARSTVGFYNSDSCEEDDLIVELDKHRDDPATTCEKMARHFSTRVWGVSVSGKCFDIRDTDFLTACKDFL